MRVAVIQIGNSRGIRIPKAVLEECHIDDTVDLKIDGEKIIISPGKERPRKTWATQLREMAKQNDDSLVLPDDLDLEAEDWEW